MSDAAPVDICIVGAGPAGSAAAIWALRKDLTVKVVDKATFPRNKCCGDGLTTGALRLLDELDFDPATVPSWKVVEDVIVSSPGGTSVEYRLPDGPGYYAAVARRQELDAALVQLARSKGADITEGAEVTGIDRSDAGVTVSLKDHADIHARFVIAADGMYSGVRKSLGLGEPDYRGDWHAFRGYFKNVNPEATSGLYVWFEPDLLPGYVWSFPLGDGTANVGFGIQRDRGISIQQMNKLWPDILARPAIRKVLGPNATPEGRHQAWPIPARLGSLPVAGDRVLFVGDAAAATDPMTGEGIGQAFETGIGAIEAIAAGGSPTDISKRYEAHLRSTMVKDHLLAKKLSSVLAHPRMANLAITITGLTPWTRRHFARWLFEDYPRAVLATPKRWHRGLFSRPGAYQT